MTLLRLATVLIVVFGAATMWWIVIRISNEVIMADHIGKIHRADAEYQFDLRQKMRDGTIGDNFSVKAKTKDANQ